MATGKRPVKPKGKASKAAADGCGRVWSPAEVAYVAENFGVLTTDAIAAHLGRTEVAVRQYCLRHRLVPKGQKTVKRNLLTCMLQMKFRHIEDFTPSRAFYRDVQMTQKRYWDLFFGRKQISTDEYVRIADYLGVTAAEAMMSRQLCLFEDDKL